METDNGALIKCRLMRLPTHSLMIDPQLASHRLVKLQLTSRKSPES